MHTFWKVEEYVGNGFYIVWPGLYTTREKARLAIRQAGAITARPMQYQTGDWNTGPLRSDPQPELFTKEN